jgi:hypothetical protein
MVRFSVFFSIYLVILLLLIPATKTLAVWDARVTYWGETFDTGYSWNDPGGELPFSYTWDPDAWDFVYEVELVDNNDDDPLTHPIDHFDIANPRLLEYEITHTPWLGAAQRQYRQQ